MRVGVRVRRHQFGIQTHPERGKFVHSGGTGVVSPSKNVLFRNIRLGIIQDYTEGLRVTVTVTVIILYFGITTVRC